VTQYRQNLDRQQEYRRQNASQLQHDKRMAQYRQHQQYTQRMYEQQRRWENERNHNYYNDPFFHTAYDRRYYRGGVYYQTNRYGIQYLQQAANQGYEEGYYTGRADREDRWRSDYQGCYAYQDANYGYNGYYLSQDDYSYYFREGFRRGYDDGYNRNCRPPTNGTYAILVGMAGIIL
jgi:hypothetical protein